MRKGQSRSFKQHFDKYACIGDSISAKLPGGFTAIAWLVPDNDMHSPPDERQDGFWPSMDPKAPGYVGPVSARTFKRQHAKATEIKRAWMADEWMYCGVCVAIEKNGVRLTDRYDHALWGIELNYPGPSRYRRNGYLRDVANELLGEALIAAQNTIDKLAA